MKTAGDSTTGQLLQKKGLEHEAAYLQRLKDEGKTVVEIPKDRNLQDRAALTLEAMKSGAHVIYQAVFVDAPWRGEADFLMKCNTPSSLGDFNYEVLDTKLARTAEPKHIMQLCVYSELLTKLQGLRPVDMHLFLGDGEKHSFRLPDIEQIELIPSGLEFWNFVDHAQVGFGKEGIGFVEFVNEHFECTVATIAAETEQAYPEDFIVGVRQNIRIGCHDSRQ